MGSGTPSDAARGAVAGSGTAMIQRLVSVMVS
jgi:hypothetical protein